MNTVAPTLAQAINDKVSEAENNARGAMQCALEAGELLLKAKAQIPHGQWESWLIQNCTVAPRTARSYMSLATRFPALPEAERQRVADLPLRDVVRAISTNPEQPPKAKGLAHIVRREDREISGAKFKKAAAVAREAAKFISLGVGLNAKKTEALKKSLQDAIAEIEKLQSADNIVEAA